MSPQRLILLMALFLFIGCSKENRNCIDERQPGAGCFSGKLVKKGPCGQAVIEILSSDKSGLQYASQWTDPEARKMYQNVFTVHNICDFPAGISEGDTFSFSIDPDPAWNCIVCQAWTATPDEKNNIQVGCAAK